MACFHVISTSLISGGDHPYAHYFLLILPLCALLLCSMTHYDITMLLGMPHCRTTMSNDVYRDVHYDVKMDNDVAMNLLCYVLLRQIMILLFHQ